MTMQGTLRVRPDATRRRAGASEWQQAIGIMMGRRRRTVPSRAAYSSVWPHYALVEYSSMIPGFRRHAEELQKTTARGDAEIRACPEQATPLIGGGRDWRLERSHRSRDRRPTFRNEHRVGRTIKITKNRDRHDNQSSPHETRF